MKKVKLLCLSILGLLFLIPLVNFSTAAPGDYVGVEEGDSYSWELYFNVAGLEEFSQDLSGTPIDVGEIEGIETIPVVTFKATVNMILPVDTILVNGTTSVTYVPVNVTISANVPGLGEQTLAILTVPIFSNETDYYLHMMYYHFMPFVLELTTIGPTFMFVAQNLNWTKAVEDVLEIYGAHIVYQNFLLTAEPSGFKLIIPEALLNGTQKEIEYKMEYTSKGVLSYAGIKYGGTTLMSISFPGADEIPGFELPIIMGTIAVVGIGLIYVIKKKNRI